MMCAGIMGLGSTGGRLSRQVGSFVVDLVFPPRCAGCRRRGHWVCGRCSARFPTAGDELCSRCGVRWCTCGSGGEQNLSVYAFGPYEDWLRQAIISFKYHAEWARHEHLGSLLVPIVTSLGPLDALVPVPLHAKREDERGYNQARLLATTVAATVNVRVAEALVRTVNTRQQATLSGDLRSKNVVGAFDVRENVAGLHIVLIDDVVTTSATLGECAEQLCRAGAASVRAVTLAHG